MFIGTLDPTSTRQGWQLAVDLVDQDTDEALDITGAVINVEVRDPNTTGNVLSGSTSDGHVTIVDTGTFYINFTDGDTQNMRPDTYEVGAILTLNGATIQVMIALLPILDGIVTI